MATPVRMLAGLRRRYKGAPSASGVRRLPTRQMAMHRILHQHPRMRRVISLLVLFTLLLAQSAPGLCTAAAGHVGASHDAAAGAHHEAPVAMHDGHDATHAHADAPSGAAAMVAQAHATSPGAVPSPAEHDDSCHDVTRCHWAAVPAGEAAAIIAQAGPSHRMALSHEALDAAAAALLTPPPRLHS